MPQKVIYTVGSSTRSQEEFVALLKSYQIDQLIDVRRFPTSRFDHFRREALSESLKKEGIGYSYLGRELGGYRTGGYESYTGTAAFSQAIAVLEELASEKRCVIMCAEKFPWRCHRRFIAQALERRGWQVIHILDRGRSWFRKINPSVPQSSGAKPPIRAPGAETGCGEKDGKGAQGLLGLNDAIPEPGSGKEFP